jgi:hypothetical protein
VAGEGRLFEEMKLARGDGAEWMVLASISDPAPLGVALPLAFWLACIARAIAGEGIPGLRRKNEVSAQ